MCRSAGVATTSHACANRRKSLADPRIGCQVADLRRRADRNAPVRGHRDVGAALDRPESRRACSVRRSAPRSRRAGQCRRRAERRPIPPTREPRVRSTLPIGIRTFASRAKEKQDLLAPLYVGVRFFVVSGQPVHRSTGPPVLRRLGRQVPRPLSMPGHIRRMLVRLFVDVRGRGNQDERERRRRCRKAFAAVRFGRNVSIHVGCHGG